VPILEEMTSPELHRLVRSGVETIVIPFGSVEGHGAHLPLGSDALIADLVGRTVAQRLNAVVAPTVRVGYADQHLHAAGTLSVPAQTLRDVALHVASSAHAHGFRVIVFVSAHGANSTALSEAARALMQRHPDAVACAPLGDVGPKPGRHSGKWLTSVMLSLRPELVDAESAEIDLIDEVRASNAEIGAENLERFISAIVQSAQETARRCRHRDR
jgi:creatinine amidohydrolase